MRIKLPLFILSFLIISVFSIETTILESLDKDDQQSLIVASQFMNLIKSERYFNRQKFTCLTMMPKNFTSQKKQTVHKLNLTFSYKKEKSILQTVTPSPQESQKQVQKKITGYQFDHDYDKILDLLHGTCVIHETNEFLYEYCHKEKVRQFDDLFTKQRMAKPEYEDIAMGYYNYQSALQKSTSPHDKGLKPGNAMYQIKYSQNGDLTILNKLLQNVPQLTSQQKQLLKKTIAQSLGVNNELNDNGQQKQSNTAHQANVKDKTVKVQLLPTRSVVYDQNNLFTVEMTNHKEYFLNKQTKIIHLNYPIVKSNKYFTKSQLVHEVICVNKNQINSQQKQGVYVSKGVVVSPFQLLFLGEVQKCDSVKQVGYKILQEKPYGELYYTNRVRVIEDIAYGYVEEVCGNNWDWQFSKNKDLSTKNKDLSTRNKLSPLKNNHIQPGTTLWLQIAVNSTTSGRVTLHQYPVTVKQVIGNNIVRMNENIIGKLNLKNVKDIVWVNSCRIISKKSINKKFHTIQNQIIKKNIIKIKQLPQKNGNNNNNNIKNDPKSTITSQKQSGDQLLCLCRFRKYSEHFLQMHLALGKKLFESNLENNYFSYFEFYETQRTVKTQKQNDDRLYTLCEGGLMCFDVEKKQDDSGQNKNQKQQVKDQQGFSKITKLTPNTQPIQQNLKMDEQIIILQTSQNGILKVHTTTSQGDKFYYLISPSMLIKYCKYSNGTKQVYKQNSFYENQTSLHYVSWFSSSVYIHKGYMWRGNDRLVFPRMMMNAGEMITMVQCVTGSGYIRQWGLNKMKNKNSNMIVDVQKMFEEHYKMIKVPVYENDDNGNKVNQQNKNQQQLTNINEQLVQNLKTYQISRSSAQKQQPFTQGQQNQESLEQQQQKLKQPSSHSKRLQKSVSVRYQYFHGDYCAHPINKYRRTNVNLQCGQPWMKIQQVKEISPCVYEMIVSTRLLCRQEYERMLERVQNMLQNDSEARVRLQKGIVCYPQDAWDDAIYVYDVQKKNIEYSTK